MKIPSKNGNESKIGLALSGGGFRAAAFHLGTLKKLHDLGILSTIDVISTISGGSIIGAYYVLNKDNGDVLNNFEEILKIDLIEELVKSGLLYSRFIVSVLLLIVFYFLTTSLSWTICFFLIEAFLILVFFYKIFPTTKTIIDLYNQYLYKNQLLKNLPDKPGLVINSTNLDTGTLFSFTKENSYDSGYYYKYKDQLKNNQRIEFQTEDYSVAKAVACSTAFPYIFAPIQFKFPLELINEEIFLTPKLADGGIYDNQGIYRITKENSKFKCDVVIVSDGSSPFEKQSFNINPLPVLKRIMELMMNRIKGMQFLQRIYEDDEKELYEIAYFSLNYGYQKCVDGFINAVIDKKIRPHLLIEHGMNSQLVSDKESLEKHIKRKIGYDRIVKKGLDIEEIKIINEIKTSLASLTKNEIDLLRKHAEILTEIQIRLYCPSLIS